MSFKLIKTSKTPAKVKQRKLNANDLENISGGARIVKLKQYAGYKPIA